MESITCFQYFLNFSFPSNEGIHKAKLSWYNHTIIVEWRTIIDPVRKSYVVVLPNPQSYNIAINK